MSWGEAVRLCRELMTEPTSHVAVALNGWQRPWPAEAFLMADLFDLMHQVNAKRKPPPYPRPTDPAPKRLGRSTRSQRDIRAALAARAPRR